MFPQNVWMEIEGSEKDSKSDEQSEGQKDSITLEDHAAPPLIHSRPYLC